MLKNKGSSEPKIELGALGFLTEQEARQHAAENLHGKIVIIHSPHKGNTAGNEYYIEDPGTMIRSWEKVVYEGYATQAAAMIQKAKHTRGPWRISGDTYPIGILVGDENDPQIVAQVGGDHMSIESDEECQANAKLIASAPELLEALRCVVNSGPLNNGLRDENTLAVARSAIAKAEGN